MKFRAEIGRTPSAGWRWFARILGNMKNHRIESSEGMEIHVVDGNDEDAYNMAVIVEHTWYWKQVAFYFNGRLVPKFTFQRQVHSALSRLDRTQEVEDLLRRLQPRAGRHGQEP